jgi:hypothetical protein
MNVSDNEITEMAVNLSTIYHSLKEREFYLGLTGDALSYTATKVATIKALLVDVKKAAEIEAGNAEAEYKKVKAETLRRLVGTPLNEDGPKISATAAADLLYGEPEVIEAAKNKDETRAQFNWLKSLVADGHDVIEAIRSRLIDLQGSRKDERV